MSAPAGPISTRSTNNRTMRALSVGNSSSHSGSSSHRASRTSTSVRSGASERAGQPRANDHLWLGKHRPHLVRQRHLDLRRRHSADDVLDVPVAIQHPLRHVVAIQAPPPPRVRRRQSPAIDAKDQPLQQRRALVNVLVAPESRALPQDGVYLVPQGARDDRLVLAGIDLPLKRGVTDIRAVVQQLVDVPLVEPPAGLATDPFLLQHTRERPAPVPPLVNSACAGGPPSSPLPPSRECLRCRTRP